jgi:acyl-CoA reductase-like NAD-dependent aldehyde dehydrogenase
VSVYNPATGALISNKIPVAGDEDVDEAVCHANEAFKPTSPWRQMSHDERRAILLKFADLLEANQERLAYLTRLTLGAPYLPFGKSEIGTAIGCFRCKSSRILKTTHSQTNGFEIMLGGLTSMLAKVFPRMMAFTRLFETNHLVLLLGETRTLSGYLCSAI